MLIQMYKLRVLIQMYKLPGERTTADDEKPSKKKDNSRSSTADDEVHFSTLFHICLCMFCDNNFYLTFVSCCTYAEY